MAMSKVLQFDCVADNVTVNNLLPGPFDTDRLAALAQRYVEDGITLDQAYARIGARGPAGRIGQPHEFGDACAFLCAAQAGYISGQCLTLDGGAYRGLFFEHAGPLGARACFTISGITVRLGGRTIIDRASATVPTGARVGLIGRNGAGKSTLMKVLIGQIEPDEGSVDMPRRARLAISRRKRPTARPRRSKRCWPPIPNAPRCWSRPKPALTRSSGRRARAADRDRCLYRPGPRRAHPDRPGL
jgi:hypothetical protein